MAFGAGCLLFAVTVELYAHTLHELAHGNVGYMEMGFQTCGALGGAYFYMWMNKWLETSFHQPDISPHPENSVSLQRQRSVGLSSLGLLDESRASRVFSKSNYQAILKMK